MSDNDFLHYLNRLADSMPGNFYWKDKQGHYLGCNHALLQMLNCTKLDILGKTDFDLWPHQAKQIRSHDKKVMEYNQTLSLKESIILADGERTYSVIKTPLRNQRGNIIGMIGHSLDITPTIMLEKQLRQEKRKAEAASRSKSEFIANMSHDIRTPITGILAMAEHVLQTANAASTPSGDQYKTHLKQLIDTVQHDIPLLTEATHALLGLCNDILDVVQLESGKIITHIETFDLNKLLVHTVHLLQPIAHNKRLNLSFYLDPIVPRHLTGMHLYLARILLNLTSNALKFTDQGFVKISAVLKKGDSTPCQPQQGEIMQLVLTVKDSGIGIPADKQAVIFEHFSRLTASYTGVYKGAGLGLYTVKQYVQAMQGEIQVVSAVGEGSCFIVTVPLKVANADILTHTQAAIAESNDENKITLNHKQRTILVVEDSAIATIGIQMQLKQLQCHVDIAKNGAEALHMAKKKRYDCIFMDVGLPDMSGTEVAKKMRTCTHCKQAIPTIVAVTGHAHNPDQRQACLDAGMQVVLSKPTSLITLKSTLNTVCPQGGTAQPTNGERAGISALHADQQPKLPALDWLACLQLYQGKAAVVRQMLSVLNQDLKTTQAVLAQAYQNRNMPALRAECHRLQGGICYLKLPALEYCLNAFHETIKINTQNEARFISTYTALQNAIQTLQATHAGNRIPTAKKAN